MTNQRNKLRAEDGAGALLSVLLACGIAVVLLLLAALHLRPHRSEPEAHVPGTEAPASALP